MNNPGELGIPGWTDKKDCGHASPQFGCDCCIKKQADAWGKEKFEAWLKTYKPPKCKECGGPLRAYAWDVTNKGLIAVVGCINFNTEVGYMPCAEHDFEVLIP